MTLPPLAPALRRIGLAASALAWFSCAYEPLLYDPLADGGADGASEPGRPSSSEDGPAGASDLAPALPPGSPPPGSYPTPIGDAAPPSSPAPMPGPAPAPMPTPVPAPAPDTRPACGTACVADDRDGCCPAGCTAVSDLDCPPRCGNGVLEGDEQCDPPGSCPVSCPSRGCARFTLEGSAAACTAVCAIAAKQTVCTSGDECCPTGCNNNSDAECPAACDNGVVERGELCEPVAECTRRQTACRSDANTLRTPIGAPASCTFECRTAARACGPSDGFCPAGCAVDADCLPRPTDCVHLQYCRRPFAPGLGMVICITDDDTRCTTAERRAECAEDAARVCGANHVRPIIYEPPIGGLGSG